LIEYAEAVVRLDFEHAAVLHALLAQHGAEKLDEAYDAQGLRLRLRIPTAALDAFGTALRNATRGRTCLLPPGEGGA
jgi:putative IMPACT (imprinted ancient) family translation regulator